MYKCRQLSSVGYYLKSQSEVVRLIFHLPKSNKGRKDDYLIALGEWSDSLHCPTWAGNPGGVPLGLVSLEKGLTISALTYIYIFTSSFLGDDFCQSDLDLLLGHFCR